MKTRILHLVAALVVGLVNSTPAAETLSETLQKGLFEEEANHNLDAAIKAYQSVLSQTDEQRKLAATAVFRLGECYRKLGRTNDATAQYERILREFSDQTTLTDLSGQNLAALGVAKTVRPQGISRAARLEQKRLLEEEIKLDEQDLQRTTELLKQKVVPQSAIAQVQRRLLELRRQLAGLDLAQESNAGGPEEGVQATSTDEEQKELQGIKAIIKDSPDLINARIQTGSINQYQTRLHKAAELGQLTVAQFLLANGAQVDALDSMNRTPLHLAALNGHKSLVELLLANKAAVDGKMTPSSTPLHLAANNGHKLVAAVLLAHGAKVNARTWSGWTPLHNAVVHGNKAVAELLLEQKADLNAASTSSETEPGSKYGAGSTPLHLAAIKSDAGLVEWLCANGADMNVKDEGDQTPLFHAAARGATAVVESLIAKKADVNTKDNSGVTPLIIAAINRNTKVLELLLEHGAEVNAQDNSSSSSLSQAVAAKHEEMVKVLLAHRPNLELQDKEGWTPLQRAVSGRLDKIVEMLLEAGASANVVSPQEGSTPLHWAAQFKSKRMVELLLAHKANVNAQNSSGKSPLDYVKINPTGPRSNLSAADERLMNEIADLLRKAGASEDLQRLSFITLSRREAQWSDHRFSRGTNNDNQYTLLELLGNFFEDTRRPSGATVPVSSDSALRFPDFAGVTIQRLKPPGGTDEIRINLDHLFKSGDCSKDIPLQWGDIVEVPELDHRINETWSGLSGQVREVLKKCLERTVKLIVKGESTKITLQPSLGMPLGLGVPPGASESVVPSVREGIVLPTFRLRNVVYGSHLLLSSSDVTRVKVKRKDPGTGKLQEMQFNLENQINKLGNAAGENDLWLRDGDIIEVPEK